MLIGYIQVDLDDLKGAREAFARVILIVSNLIDGKDDQGIQRTLATVFGSLAWVELLDHQPQKAIDLSTKGLAIDPTQAWIKTNLAHGHLFSHQYEQAKAIYLENKDVKINNQQTFGEAVLDDFLKFRQKGLIHPDMERVELLLRPLAPSTPR